MFSLNRVNSHNPSIIANLTNKNNPNSVNKNNNFSNYLQDEYVSAAKANLLSGVCPKETEQNEEFQKEYEQYCCILLYSPTATDFQERVYFPPPNAPDDVKKAWIETMKSLSPDEQRKVGKAVLSVVQRALGKPGHKINGKMYQDYLNKYASFSGIEGFYFKNLLDSKYDPFMKDVLNIFKTNYEKYSEEQ